jgi:thiol-disulfide isomerase/thioredoxin
MTALSYRRAPSMYRVVAIVVALVACQANDSPPDRAAPAPPHQKLELVDAAPSGDVPAYLAPLVAKAHADGRKLVVYVGASWCEPCQRFHAAAVAGELDATLGDLRLVVFDADRDDPRLTAAGFKYTMIPLFALPTADGHSSGRQIAGSVKGERAVAQIAPNLRRLVDQQ